MPRPLLTPEVPSESVRTPVVVACRHCRAALALDSRAMFCSGRCRAAWHRHQREEARAVRDREIRSLLEAALRRLEEGAP